ncbi:hypothetical protein ACFX15_042828 [Malus domestica]
MDAPAKLGFGVSQRRGPQQPHRLGSTAMGTRGDTETLLGWCCSWAGKSTKAQRLMLCQETGQAQMDLGFWSRHSSPNWVNSSEKKTMGSTTTH